MPSSSCSKQSSRLRVLGTELSKPSSSCKLCPPLRQRARLQPQTCSKLRCVHSCCLAFSRQMLLGQARNIFLYIAAVPRYCQQIKQWQLVPSLLTCMLQKCWVGLLRTMHVCVVVSTMLSA